MAIARLQDLLIRRRDFLKMPALAGLTMAAPAGSLISCDSLTAPGTADVQQNWYEKLAEALDKLPNGFPRTQSNIELALLKKIFLPQEAYLAGHLTRAAEPASSIAQRAGLSTEEATSRLKSMMARGFVLGDAAQGYFRLAPFVVGIYENQLPVMDYEMATLFEEYMDQGGYKIMEYPPYLHRVIPSQSAVKTEWILPYDMLVELMNSCNTFRVNDCICRKQQDLVGTRKCNFPLHVELQFYHGETTMDPPVAPFVAKEEALAILAETERIGLVHTATNAAEGVYYVCNCCGCCCGILRGITRYGLTSSVAAANYYAVTDPASCQGCGICTQRCQLKAVSVPDKVSVVDRTQCVGCGLCVTGCPAHAARLEPKPASERVDPPKDFATWEQERLVSRGMGFSPLR